MLIKFLIFCKKNIQYIPILYTLYLRFMYYKIFIEFKRSYCTCHLTMIIFYHLVY